MALPQSSWSQSAAVALATREPAVSVLVPCRNEGAYIEACLRTILAQEEPPGGFEVIIADGMSQDGTRAKLARIAAEDNRVKLVDNAGRIVSTGLNAAISIARGGILVRMDGHALYVSD